MNGHHFKKKEGKYSLFGWQWYVCIYMSERKMLLWSCLYLYSEESTGRKNYLLSVQIHYRDPWAPAAWLQINFQLQDEVKTILYFWYEHPPWTEINGILEITEIFLALLPLYWVKHEVADAGTVFIIFISFVPLEEILFFMVQTEFNWL